MIKNDFTFKVDSAKISIPLSKCNIHYTQLQEAYQLLKSNLVTGELTMVKEYSGDPFVLNTDFGTYYKVWIENQIVKKGLCEPFVSVLINSKHLGKDYFKGITTDTFKQLYENVMSQKVFSCSFADFKEARYIDTDIAFDFKCTTSVEFPILKKNILSSCLDTKDWATTDKNNNSGIWTPKTPINIKPRDFATPSKPYLKFYSKEIDFKYRSTEFATKFDLFNEAKDLVRFEATIKNSKHKKLLKIDNVKTIWQLLNADLNKIASDIFKRYFEKRKFVKSKNETPMDKALIDIINLAIEKGATKEEIIRAFDRSDVSKRSNYNLMQKYHQLYSENKIKKEVFEANEISKSVFNILGVSEQLKINLTLDEDKG